MPENPYRSSNVASFVPRRTRPTPWLIWSGVTSLVLAAVCFVITVVGMMIAFNTLADSTAASPSDLALYVGVATIPSIAAVPLGILGLALLITGFLVRQPED